MKKKEITMTISEFMNIQRGNLTLNEVKMLNMKVDRIDRKTYKIVVTTMATVLFMLANPTVVFANTLFQTNTLSRLSSEVMQEISYFILLAAIAIELFRYISFNKRENSMEILGMIFKYAVAFSLIYFTPYIIDTLKTILMRG